MLERRQPVLYAWDGAIPTREIPTDVLYDVRFELGITDARTRLDAIAEALRPLGAVRVRRLPILPPRIRVHHDRHPMTVKVHEDHIEVALHHRVKGRLLGRVVEAFTTIPGTKDLTIRAASPHFDPAYSDVRPCTTCAAARLPPRRR